MAKFNEGDKITMKGVEYTYNGNSWTYLLHDHPYSVTSIHTFAGTPTPDIVAGEMGGPVTPPNLVDTYDWEILSRLAIGSIYANEVQVSF